MTISIVALVFFIIILFLSIVIFYIPSFFAVILGALQLPVLVGYAILLLIFIIISIIKYSKYKSKKDLSNTFCILGILIITIGIIFIYKDFDYAYYSFKLAKNIKKEFKNVDVIKNYDYSKDKKNNDNIIVGKTIILNDNYRIPFQVYVNTDPMFGYANIYYSNNYFYKYGPTYLKEFNNKNNTNLEINFDNKDGNIKYNYICSSLLLCHIEQNPDLKKYIKYVNSKSPDNIHFTIDLIYDYKMVDNIHSWNID